MSYCGAVCCESDVLIIFNSPALTRILRVFEINSNSFDSNRRQYWPHSHLIHLIRITAKIGHIHIEFTFTFNPSSPPTRTRAKYVSHQPDRRAARRHEGAVWLLCVRLYRGKAYTFCVPCRCRCVPHCIYPVERWRFSPPTTGSRGALVQMCTALSRANGDV